MAVFKSHKKSLSLLIIPVLLLIISGIISSFSQKENITALTSVANNFLPELDANLLDQFQKSIAEDSSTIYSAKLHETDYQRELVLIKKNPTKRQFLNQIQVHVYPKNVNLYKDVSNYNQKGYLDFTNKETPIKYHHNSDNYSVKNINIPFIDIDKIFILQPGIFKKTIEIPFPEIDKNSYEVASKISVDKSKLYEPILHNTFNKEKLRFATKRNDSESVKNLIEISEPQKFWKLISEKSTEAITFIKVNDEASTIAVQKLEKGITENKPFNEVFDVEKLAAYYSIINLFSNNTSNKLTLLYDGSSGLFEPFYRNQNQLGELNTYVKNQNISDARFNLTYAKKLDEYSSISIDDLIKNTANLETKIKQFNHVDPSILFERNVLIHNQYVLKKGVTPSTGVKVEFLSLEDNTLTVSIKNLSYFPIRINELNFQTEKSIVKPKNSTIINRNKKDTIHFNLPRSFENLFVDKKTKTTGFIFEKNITDLVISYSVNGLSDVYFTEIIPYQAIEAYNKNEDLFRHKIALKNRDYLTVDETNKIITISKDFTLKSPLIFPKNYTITAKPGTTINIEENGKIISYSPFNFIGTKEQPIQIISKDKEGQGLLVMGQDKLSQLNYVYFDGLTNPSHGSWSTTSAVTFYESPVNFDYVKISNNSCEDAINVVRAHFNMRNTRFENTQSDAFDGDFVTGNINSCVFENLGNDAIDVSGSDLNISNVKVINAGDKALSAGEDSKMTINKVSVTNCEIALAGKDLSIVSIKNLTIKDTKLGFTAFQKKPEFGPSSITASNITMDNVETDYLIENTSALTVDGQKIETKLADVKSKMYGVEFGVSSDETRNRKEN